MSKKKVLSGPKQSSSLYDILPTIVFALICVGLIAHGDIFNYRSKKNKCSNRDCRIFKVKNMHIYMIANVDCKEKWNKTIAVLSPNNTNSLNVDCYDDGISQCHVLHNLLCQSCRVCFYGISNTCYSCQNKLKVTIMTEGLESMRQNVSNGNSWKVVGFMENLLDL